jgi:hypothetical protein
MKASELIVKLQEEVEQRGDRDVVLSVTFPHETYEVEPEEPVTSGHIGTRAVVYVEAGEPA